MGSEMCIRDRRNRILISLSEAVVAVEFREKSGTLRAVREGIRQRKLVFAVPGPIDSALSFGTNNLHASPHVQPALGADFVLSKLGYNKKVPSNQTKLPFDKLVC